MEVGYRVNPSVPAEYLNTLFTASWDEHSWIDFDSILCRSLGFVCTYREERLIGFVNPACD